MSPLVRVDSWLRMGNNFVRGSAFVALPGRKFEKMKGQKAERSKKSFFSLCTGSQTGAKSSIFEHNTTSASVSPSNKTFKDLVAKGHSSFNEESFVQYSPQSGSLTHSPVTGKLVCSPSSASFSQSELVKEAFSDPGFLQQVRGLEAMLRVRERGGDPVSSGRAVAAHFGAGEDDPLCTMSEIPGFQGVCSVHGERAASEAALVVLDSAGEAGVGRAAFETDPIDTLAESAGAGCVDVAPRSVDGASAATVAPCAVSVEHAVATNKCDLELGFGAEPVAQRGLVEPEARVSEETSRADSSFSVHVSSHARTSASLTVSCLARPAGSSAAVAAVASVASPVVSRVRSYAQVAAAACDDAIALHNSSLCSRNSGGTGGLLPVQRSTSYRLDNSCVGNNSCRKVRSSCTIGSRSVVQTVDMSPAPAAGTYRRSADEVHGQRQISRKRQAACSVGDPVPGAGPGPGGRSGLVGGSLGCAAAIRGIPCSLVMPPGRHQRAPQSLGWEWVCGSEKSGVWVLKGDTRTYNLPRNLDDVGIVWERRSGYETAWATPGHVCSCSYGYGHGPVLPQPNPSVFTEAIKLWSRVASLLTPWCAKGEVPTGVNLNRYAGDGSFIPWHRDNERLFGSPSEPKVIVSMSLGHSVLFKLCRRASKKTRYSNLVGSW